MNSDGKPTCEFLFSEAGMRGAELQDAVDACYPDGECELVSVAPHSPGSVADLETLTRLIIHPIHFDKGVVSPMAFHDATSIDLSVFREDLAKDAELQSSIDAIRQRGDCKVPPEERICSLIMQASAGAIRSLRFEVDDSWMCRVYDTGTPDKPAHASVFTPTSVRAEKSRQRYVRRALLTLFTEKQFEPSAYRSLNY